MLQKDIKERIIALVNTLSKLKERLSALLRVSTALKLVDRSNFFAAWTSNVDKLILLVSKANDHLDELMPAFEACMLKSQDYEVALEDLLKRTDEESKKYSPEQIAWDTLTTLENELEHHKSIEVALNGAKLAYERAMLLRTSFDTARETILNELYKTIEGDFVTFYRELHGDDEKSFEAIIEAKGPELNIEVDFYGRGKYPPIALHSEGHQDSMGLSLYLALMKLLTQNIVELTILDDVVMSIDAEHRRAFCKLLKSKFKDRQFLITTHNRTWAKQLRTEGIVVSENMIEFQRWTVDTGPIFQQEADAWKEIGDLIAKNNITEAAAKLREHAEFFFEQVCESLEAKVVYRSDSRWELGDFLPAAITRYKELIAKAKNVANSWGEKELTLKFSEINSVASENFARSGAEQWAINENVHYSKWKDFEKNDFIPVADAFRDLFSVFKCSKCGGLLAVTKVKYELSSLCCSCKTINWNLKQKNS